MITLKENSRTLLVPEEEKYFGVESDEKVESRQFEIPRMTANGMDLSSFALRINYFNAANVPGQYIVNDAEVNGDMISFSWEFSRKVTAAEGKVLFIICAVSLDESGDIENEWNTEPAEGFVGKGLEVSDPDSGDAEDVINNIIQSENPDLMINAKSYGLKGDGSTDDAPLLIALVSELNGKGGGTIYLPNGRYKLNSRVTWKSNVSLVGESYKAILMPYCDMSQGFAAISWLNTDGTQQAEYDSSNPMVNCHFRNFTIDGINQNPSVYDSYPKGINMHFLKNCTFEKIQFLNIYATGLGVDFLEDVFIHNIYCYNCGRGYVVTTDEKIAGGAGIGIGTMGMEKESCIISDCIADGCGNYGIFVEGGSTFPENGCNSHYTIANCQCINGRNYGIAVKCTDNVMIANNIMRNNARDGFAMLKRDSRRCVNVQIVGNLSTLNAGCGFRFADGDNADYISEHIYVKDNVSYNNTKDGILFSTIITNTFVENNIFKSNNRGIAISNNTYNELYFTGNRVIDCVTNLVFDGLFNNKDLFNNQLVRMCGVHEKEYDMVYVDDNGNEIEHASSKTTRKFTYCKGSLYCGFYFESAYEQTDTESRICYCHWYDENMNFISREGTKVNSSGWKRFTPPEGACYVKYRIGINIGTLENSQLKGVYLVRYMTDRCEMN